MRTDRNQLLASLADDDFDRLLPHLRPHALAAHAVIERRGEPIGQVTFPATGLLSVLAEDGGEQIEAAMVGRDGMTGTGLLLGARTAAHSCRVQIAGEAVSIAADEVSRAILQPSRLR